jgi:peptide/nickel transport system substrate-binding protein
MASPPPGITRRGVVGLSVAAALGAVPRAAGAAPQGELRIASHVSLAPTWFDPAETAGIITPFMMLYAMHDAMLKAMPDDQMAPCLAESCTMAPDGLSYAFTLRKGVLFHNGEALTADDVKFSLERYRGSSSKTLKERVAGVDIHDPHRLTIRLTEPWPDFLTFYAGATGAGWIVPRKYVQQVGEDGFKKAPVGAGPYKFVSFTPGVELVCEAFEGYWRKPPAVKRLVFKVVPDEATRLAPCSAARSTSPIRSAASWPTSSRARPAWGSRRRWDRRRSGCTSPISGMPSRRGTTGACGWRPISRSTTRPSTRH